MLWTVTSQAADSNNQHDPEAHTATTTTNQPTNRPTDQPTNRPNEQTNDQPTNRPTDQPTNNQTNKQTNKQASKQANKQTNKQTKTHNKQPQEQPQQPQLSLLDGPAGSDPGYHVVWCRFRMLRRHMAYNSDVHELAVSPFQSLLVFFVFYL